MNVKTFGNTRLKNTEQLRGDGRNKAACEIRLHLNAAGSLQAGQSISSGHGGEKPNKSKCETIVTIHLLRHASSRIHMKTYISMRPGHYKLVNRSAATLEETVEKNLSDKYFEETHETYISTRNNHADAGNAE